MVNLHFLTPRLVAARTLRSNNQSDEGNRRRHTKLNAAFDAPILRMPQRALKSTSDHKVCTARNMQTVMQTRGENKEDVDIKRNWKTVLV